LDRAGEIINKLAKRIILSKAGGPRSASDDAGPEVTRSGRLVRGSNPAPPTGLDELAEKGKQPRSHDVPSKGGK